MENLNIHFEWFFGFDYFIQKKIEFTVDVEGKNSEIALAMFDKRYNEFEKTYMECGISYRPTRRKNSIGFKEYVIEQDINQIADVFIKSFNEFRFLETYIDDVISNLQN